MKIRANGVVNSEGKPVQPIKGDESGQVNPKGTEDPIKPPVAVSSSELSGESPLIM